jgi:hypothetical protein
LIKLGDPTNQLVFDTGTFDTTITCPVPAANRALTIPDAGAATDTFVLRDMTQTITGKTLTGNIAVNLKSGAATITLPTTTSSLATIALAETLTSKTLTAPIIATIVNTGTLTLPTSTDTLVARSTSDTLKNKIFEVAGYGSYNNGTMNVSMVGTTNVAGSGTTFTVGMAPGYLLTSDITVAHRINSYVSGTSLTAQTAATITSLRFGLYYGAYTSYTTGTVAQTGYIVTGAGTTFTADMVGGFLYVTPSIKTVAYITKYISATSLLVSNSATVAALSSYTLDYNFPSCYSNMTASQSTTTITGVGTTFTSDMVNGILTYDDFTTNTITAFNSTTSLTTVSSATVTGQGFTIQYGAPWFMNTSTTNVNLYAPQYEVARFDGANYKSRANRCFMNFLSGVYLEDGGGGQDHPQLTIGGNMVTGGVSTRTQYSRARFTESNLQLFDTTNQLVLGGGREIDVLGHLMYPYTTISCAQPIANRTLTIPASVSCNMILDQVDSGAQTINGNTTMFNVTLTGDLKLPTAGRRR